MARVPLISVEDALARIIQAVAPTHSEDVSLARAHGRVLAADLSALRTQPPFPASAMDGYAVRHSDLGDDAKLLLVGEAAAGHPYNGVLNHGEAVRIFTGGVVPDGADTILIQEDAERLDGHLIRARQVPVFGAYVRPAGQDFAEGQCLVERGTLLGPNHISLCASGNYATVPVHRAPRVGILATGDELVPPGDDLKPGQIIASNSFGIAALCEDHGAQAVDFGIARDEPDDLKRLLRAMRDADCDVILTLGGASVGDHDIVQPVLKMLGMLPDFWKIAMRPGKPLMFGQWDGIAVVGLPGNPVSAQVCAHVFVLPVIRAMTGRDPIVRSRKAVLSHDIGRNGDRQHYMRAVLSQAEGTLPAVSVHANQDSSLLTILAHSNALVLRPAHDPERNAGSEVDVMML